MQGDHKLLLFQAKSHKHFTDLIKMWRRASPPLHKQPSHAPRRPAVRVGLKAFPKEAVHKLLLNKGHRSPRPNQLQIVAHEQHLGQGQGQLDGGGLVVVAEGLEVWGVQLRLAGQLEQGGVSGAAGLAGRWLAGGPRRRTGGVVEPLGTVGGGQQVVELERGGAGGRVY